MASNLFCPIFAPTCATPKPAFPHLMWSDVAEDNERLQYQLASRPPFARSLSLDFSQYSLPLSLDAEVPVFVGDSSTNWDNDMNVAASSPVAAVTTAAATTIAAVTGTSTTTMPPTGATSSPASHGLIESRQFGGNPSPAAGRSLRVTPRRTRRFLSNHDEGSEDDEDAKQRVDPFIPQRNANAPPQRDNNDVDAEFHAAADGSAFEGEGDDDPHVMPWTGASAFSMADDEDYATELPWGKAELTMSVRELNAWTRARGLSAVQARDLKLARRRIKNRFYARDSRARRHYFDGCAN